VSVGVGASAACPLCAGAGGIVLARTPRWRLIRAEEAGFPAFYRVVWNEHVREFSDLSSAERTECMDVVVQVETLIRKHLRPAKVNLAALGNAVPHLHWHVIARFDWDTHFPGAVWAAPVRAVAQERIAEIAHLCNALDADLGKLGHSA